MTEAPSPFLPNTNVQFAWDSTSLEKLKRCPRLYQYEMIDGWTTKDESVHLRFGIEYHQALQDYDLSRAAGIPHDDAVHDVIRELLIRTASWWPEAELMEMKGSAKVKSRSALIRTVVWYLEHFKEDKAEVFIKSDGKPAVEQSFRFELNFGPQSAMPYEQANTSPKEAFTGTSQPYLLCGHLDRIVTFNDELFVMDRKTSSFPLTSWYFDQYEPHNQMTLYSLAAKVVLDAPVRGVIIDAAQVKEETIEFGRGLTFRTPDQLEEWVTGLRFWLTLAEQYAVTGHWPMNDTACDKYGGCRFREICSKSPSVRERFLEASFVKQPPEERWNPLKAR